MQKNYLKYTLCLYGSIAPIIPRTFKSSVRIEDDLSVDIPLVNISSKYGSSMKGSITNPVLLINCPRVRSATSLLATRFANELLVRN